MLIKIECLGARYQNEIISNRYLIAICPETGAKLAFRSVWQGRFRQSTKPKNKFEDNYLLISPLASGRGNYFDILSARTDGEAIDKGDAILRERYWQPNRKAAISQDEVDQLEQKTLFESEES